MFPITNVIVKTTINKQGKIQNEFEVKEKKMRRNFFQQQPAAFAKNFLFFTSTLSTSFSTKNYHSSSDALLRRHRGRISTNETFVAPSLFSQKCFQFGGSSDDYYHALGVSPAASTAEIKSAYKKLAMQYHPDRNKEASAEEKFKKVSEAYSVLSNTDKKRQYDAMRSYSHGGSGGGMGGGMSGGSGQPNYASRGPGANAGAYGPGSSYHAQYSSRSGPGQQQQQTGRAGQSSFVFHNISKDEADQIFASIFGMGGGGGGAAPQKRGGGGGMRSGNPMDDIFGRPGMHPSQASAARQQQQGPQVPPGSVLQSKSTSRNPDGTFQRDETWRLPDGRLMKISQCYDKSGSPPEDGSPESFQQRSGGFQNFSEHVGANYQSKQAQQQQSQQQSQQQQQPPQYDASGQRVNFPQNPFSQGGFGGGNPFGSPGSGFGSQSQSQSGGGGGTGFNPFQQSYQRSPQPGQQQQQQSAGFQNPFASFASSQGGSGGGFSQSTFNPFASFMSGGSGGGGPSRGAGGTGGAFAGGSSTQQNPFAQYFGQRSGNPMGGMWFYSPGVRFFAVSLLIGFVLASLLSFSIHHPLFFIFIMTLLVMSRGRRFF